MYVYVYAYVYVHDGAHQTCTEFLVEARLGPIEGQTVSPQGLMRPSNPPNNKSTKRNANPHHTLSHAAQLSTIRKKTAPQKDIDDHPPSIHGKTTKPHPSTYPQPPQPSNAHTHTHTHTQNHGMYRR